MGKVEKKTNKNTHTHTHTHTHTPLPLLHFLCGEPAGRVWSGRVSGRVIRVVQP